MACSAKSQATLPPLLDSLKARIEERQTRREDGCIVYPVKANGKYGQIEYGRKTYYAHRASYMVYKGPIPDGLHVCHSCDNPACINPDHLWLGTQKENIQDMLAKGRDNYRFACKLTDAQIEQIREALDANESQTSIGARFGVSSSYVSMIGSGRRRNVPRDEQAA